MRASRDFGSAITTISGSTIKDNRRWGIHNVGRLEIVNSTVTANSSACTWACGGISNDHHMILNNVTVTANRGQGINSADSGEGQPVAIVRNSIVWGNLPHASWHRDCDAVNSAGNNLIGTASPETSLDASDQIGVDPLLGPLQDNGGTAPTFALLDGSPALDAGGSDCEHADQRGVPRPQAAACDIGAYERLACNYDGNLDAFEGCDDGNAADGDGCSSLCETELLSGAAMLMRSAPDNPAAAKVALSSKDPAMSVGRGNFSADDPVVHGGHLRLYSATSGFDVILDLPAENWSYFGKPGHSKGYRYKAPAGPITYVQVRNGKLLKLKGGGSALGYSLGQSPDPIAVEITLGNRRYYMEFGGDVSFSTDRSFKARNAPAPSAPPM